MGPRYCGHGRPSPLLLSSCLTFKIAAVSHLEFSKFKFSKPIWLQSRPPRHSDIFLFHSLNRCGEMVPSFICCTNDWDHPWRVFDGLWHCAKFGWNWHYIFTMCKFQCYASLAWKCLLMPFLEKFCGYNSDGSRHFSDTETFCQDVKTRDDPRHWGLDWDETGSLLKRLRLRHCQGAFIKTQYRLAVKQQPQEQTFYGK